MLKIENLTVAIEDKPVLRNINAEIPTGETHILFGPNGSGKTSLIMALLGYPKYKVQEGKITFNGADITHATIEERALLGVGMAFQNAPVIKGLSLQTLIDVIKKPGVDLTPFIEKLRMNDLLHRDVNRGFSGGEKKRSEILQLLAQNPSFLCLDEPESGVDIENMDIMGKVLGRFLERDQVKKRTKSGLIITHTGYILDYVNADKGYILIEGELICSGNPYQIFEMIKEKGFKECASCQL